MIGFDHSTEGHVPEGGRAADHERHLRQAISHELHQGPEQRLVVALVALQLVRDEMPQPPARVIELLDEVAAHARHALDDLRELEAAIHPAILTTRGLSPAVEGLAGRASLPVSVGSRLPARLPEELEAHAYYLVAELLAEATQDQSATHVGISLGTLGAALTIEIAVDLGPGSQQADLRVGHDGVALRTRALGGTLVRTARRGRVVVRLELPIPSTSTGVPASGDEG